MTDRELLELAAKAYGCVGLTWRNGSQCFYYDDPETGREQWDPLQDDGQAMRLAVNLGIDMYFWVSGVEAQHSDIPQQPIQHYKGDRAAATRRAVTLVAAEIGKTRSD